MTDDGPSEFIDDRPDREIRTTNRGSKPKTRSTSLKDFGIYGQTDLEESTAKAAENGTSASLTLRVLDDPIPLRGSDADDGDDQEADDDDTDDDDDSRRCVAVSKSSGSRCIKHTTEGDLCSVHRDADDVERIDE